MQTPSGVAVDNTGKDPQTSKPAFVRSDFVGGLIVGGVTVCAAVLLAGLVTIGVRRCRGNGAKVRSLPPRRRRLVACSATAPPPYVLLGSRLWCSYGL
jgi:hypothetical protein